MIGISSLWFSLAASVSAILFYWFSQKKDVLFYARFSFLSAIVGIFIASAALFWVILTHQFQYAVVANYSSRELSFPLLLSTFWAGQEGSFLLWALIAAGIGIVLFSQAVRKKMEVEIILPYSSILFFLLLLLTVQSPFKYIWDVQKDIPVGFVPANGRGLNPLLQNFWMIIHPPLLFVGFALLAVPATFAWAALWKRNYQLWIQDALPWLLVSIVFLGAGLIFGGYWAYGVLGWGGWWGWDPVENLSLVPWLLAIILVHTMLVQQKTSKLLRTNFVLTLLTFVSVLYSTFLTRSGVLENASVHSFVSPGTATYSLLISWIAAIIISFALLFIRRWKEMSLSSSPSPFVSRESMMVLAAMILGMTTLVVLFGTSLPLLMQRTVEASFYNDTTLPLVVCSALVLGISLLINWQEDGKRILFRRFLTPAVLAGCGTVLAAIGGVREYRSMMLVFAALFAFFSSLRHGYRLVKEHPEAIGGALSHAGIALFLLSIVASGRYEEKETLTLTEGTTQKTFGMQITYLGALETSDGKVQFGVQVEKNTSATILLPEMYFSEFTQSVMKNPDYWVRWNEDVYIEPVSFKAEKLHSENVVELKKDVSFPYKNKLIVFRRFRMDEHGKESMAHGGTLNIGADIELISGKEKEILTPFTLYDQDGSHPTPAFSKKDSIGILLLSMHIPMDKEPAKVRVAIISPGKNDNFVSQNSTLVVDVSRKPFMSFVWISSFFVLVGVAFAWHQRQKIARKERGE